jgi:hypothetical protein
MYDRFEMMRFPEPVGADNDKYLAELIAGAGIVVAAWGAERAAPDALP